MIRRRAHIAKKAGEPYYEPTEEKVEVWPHLVKREYIAAAACVLFIMIWSMVSNAPLESIANPNVTTNPSKAPWYFVGLQELLVYFDPWIAGVVMPNLIIVGLMAIPFIDTNPKGVGYYAWNERKFANTMFILGVVMWFVLIFIGYFMRGPNYFWYWPWESWLTPKAPPPPTWSVFGPSGVAKLPLLLGIPVMGVLSVLSIMLPKWVQKDIDGKKANALCLGALAAVMVLMKLAFKVPFAQSAWLLVFGWMYFYYGLLMPQRHIRNLDWPRYIVTMVLVVSTMSVLLKMGARLAFDIKYVLTIPSISMNF